MSDWVYMNLYLSYIFEYLSILFHIAYIQLHLWRSFTRKAKLIWFLKEYILFLWSYTKWLNFDLIYFIVCMFVCKTYTHFLHCIGLLFSKPFPLSLRLPEIMYFRSKCTFTSFVSFGILSVIVFIFVVCSAPSLHKPI